MGAVKAGREWGVWEFCGALSVTGDNMRVTVFARTEQGYT